jgi:uncharacterized damage-inducible protein DinB
MSSDDEKILRKQLLNFLDGHQAHVDFDDAVRDLPAKLRGAKPDGIVHSVWELLEHIRRAQFDILEFIRNPDYESPPWPEGYWPETESPPGSSEWNKSVKSYKEDLKALRDIAEDPNTDLFSPIPHGTGQTTLREILLVVDHSAYHLGQLVLVRKALGAWKK